MHTLRFPFAAGSALLVVLAIFTGLSTFISKPVRFTTAIEVPRTQFTPKAVARPPPTPRPEKVVRRPTPAVPRGLHARDDIAEATPVRYERVMAGGFVPGKVVVDIARGGLPQIGQDRDVMPLVRVPPEFPPGVNTEGWVKVQYAITAAGSVRDAFVVDASPKGVFEAAALKAIARWRYTPKIQDGVAVERIGVETVIRFQLE